MITPATDYDIRNLAAVLRACPVEEAAALKEWLKEYSYFDRAS